MSLTQQQGAVDQAAPFQVASLAPWRYLWLAADPVAGAGGGGASAWWTGSPGGGRVADLVLTAGQSQMVDTGAVSAQTLWVAGDLEWITDSEPISEQVTQSTQVTLAAGSTVMISSGTIGISGPVTLAAGQQVIVSAGSVAITGGQGGNVNVATSQPAQNLGMLTFSTGGAAQTWTLPYGTQALKIVFWANAASSLKVLTLGVKGNTTGSYYFSGEPPDDTMIFAIDQATEASVTVSAWGAPGPLYLSAIALFGTAAVDVGNSPNQPLFTSDVSPNANLIGYTLNTYTNGQQVMPAPSAGHYHITMVHAIAAAADWAALVSTAAAVMLIQIGASPTLGVTSFSPPYVTNGALQYQAKTVSQSAQILVYGWAGA